jgi:CCR4-NOT complex subunit CAF16
LKSPEVRIPAREQRDLALWNTLGMASMADVDAVVQVRNLDFRFDSRLPFVLRDVSMDVPRGSRTLLIGANGAGKSSLMRILAGRHFHSPSKCQIFGRPAFHDTSLGRIVALLGERWGYETMGDITVEKLVNGLENPDWDRIEQLMDVLEVEWDWSIFRLSDGQRRRVQLLLGLAHKKELLLLDEVTTDLDVVARQNLLRFLKEESEQRGVTLIYATHIFDGLEDWATDIVYLTNGKISINSSLKDLEGLQELRQQKVPAPLFRLVEVWLRKEFEEQKAAKKANGGNDMDVDLLCGKAERTVNTGFSRGSVIPTPNLNAAPEPEREKTQAQKDRLAWQLQQNGTATVCTDEGEGLFTAGLPAFSAGRLGFNKTNPLGAR